MVKKIYKVLGRVERRSLWDFQSTSGVGYHAMGASTREVPGLLKMQPEQGFLEELTSQWQRNDYQKSFTLTEGVKKYL